MFKKLVLIMALLSVSSLCFSQVDAPVRILVGTGVSVPLENFSKTSDLGFSGGVGIEKQLTNKIAGVAFWTYTKNNVKDTVGSYVGNAFTAQFKYYFKEVAFKKVTVSAYLIFGAGASMLDINVDNVSPEVVLGTTTGAGVLFKIIPEVYAYGEGQFLASGTEEASSRFGIRFGVAVPIEIF